MSEKALHTNNKTQDTLASSKDNLILAIPYTCQHQTTELLLLLSFSVVISCHQVIMPENKKKQVNIQ
jgi:hypothetical protein